MLRLSHIQRLMIQERVDKQLVYSTLVSPRSIIFICISPVSRYDKVHQSLVAFAESSERATTSARNGRVRNHPVVGGINYRRQNANTEVMTLLASVRRPTTCLEFSTLPYHL